MARSRARRNPAGDLAILAWEDDPGEPPVRRNPIARPAPNLNVGSLPIVIRDPAPALGRFQPGTPEFRYWTAADALGRASEFWNGLLGGTTWQRSNGKKLPVVLDQGVQFNAFYDRNGLHFFHGTTQGTTVFSAESPDVVCHELGHAILDALRPQLWDALSGEVAGFHESFGDMSAILTALRLPQFATRVLTDTMGRIGCTSRLSRVAEQLGWAIRQCRPDAVAPDCLRDAVNSFFYQPPEDLPPQAPSAQLSSAPHSLSRVFTAAFLDILAGMLPLQPAADEAGLAKIATDAGTLLVEAVRVSPVVPTYLSQVAVHMIQIDRQRNNGRYFTPLRNGFVRRGILSVEAATTPPPPAERLTLGIAATEAAAETGLTRLALEGTRFGLEDELVVYAASQPRRFAVAGAAPDIGEVDPVDHDRAATGFLEDLVRRGRVDFGEHAEADEPPSTTHQTHVVVRERNRLVLRRRHFDCGFDCCGC